MKHVSDALLSDAGGVEATRGSERRPGARRPPKGLISLRGHHFLATAINHDSVVVDLGAHLGEFSSEMSTRFGCRCYAVEAHPRLHELIAETPLVMKFNYAVGASDGLVRLRIGQNLEASHIVSAADPAGGEEMTVQGVSFERLLSLIGVGSVDLLKVDIEGAEIALFNSLPDEALRSLKQITVEFHDFIEALNCGPEVEAIKTRLRSLGFACVVFSRHNNGDVLFINTALCPVNPLRLAYVKYFARYYRGLLRVIGRAFKSNGDVAA